MDDKLQNILKVAFELFSKYGIRSISMDGICKEMSISKKTLYQYVSSKEDLVNKLFEKEQLKRLNEVQSIEKQNLNAIESLFEVSKTISLKLAKISSNMAYDLFKYYPEIFNKHNQKKRKLLVLRVVSNLKKGIEEGFYRTDLNIELVAQLYIKRLEDLLDPECWLKKQYSSAKIFEVMFENHIRGISNSKGIEYLEQKKHLLNLKTD